MAANINNSVIGKANFNTSYMNYKGIDDFNK